MRRRCRVAPLAHSGARSGEGGLQLCLRGRCHWLGLTIRGARLPARVDVCLINHGGLPEYRFHMPQVRRGRTRRLIAVRPETAALRLIGDGLDDVSNDILVTLQPLSAWSVIWRLLLVVRRLRPALGGTVGVWRKSLFRWYRKGYREMRWDLFCDYELAIGCPGTAVVMRHDEQLQRCRAAPATHSPPVLNALRFGFLIDVGTDAAAVQESLASLAALRPAPGWVGLLEVPGEALGPSRAAVEESGLTLREGPWQETSFAAHTDWVAWLRAGDQVEPGLTSAVLEAMRHAEGLQLLYTDDDQIAAAGRFCSPRYKCDWSPDWLYGSDYIGRAVLLRAQLLDEVRARYPGLPLNDPYPHVLAASFGLAKNQVQHLPEIFFHQVHPRTAEVAAGDHAAALLTRQFPGLSLTPGRTSHSRRLKWPLPPRPPRVAIIIPTRDGGDLLARCLESIWRRTDYAPYEVIVVDNGSKLAGTLALLDRQAEQGRVKILTLDIPFNFSILNNRAVEHTDSELLLFLNDDVEVIGSDWLSELATNAWRPPIGCVGAKLLYPDQTIQHAGVVTGMPTAANHVYRFFPSASVGYLERLCSPQNYSAVTAACLAIRRQVFEEVGGFDETLAVNFNDLDLCLRVRAAGYRNLWTPWALLYHHESVTRGQEERRARQARGRRESLLVSARWAIEPGQDPYYNPNLATDRFDFSPAPCRRP